MNIFLILGVMIFITSCNQDSEIYTEIVTEVYNVTEYSEEPKLGAIQFSDSYIYDSKGKEIQYRIYNTDGSLKGSEIKDYSETESPSKSLFYDANDQLLSYYKLEYNTDGLLDRKLGFEANTDELLRIEKYHYDQQGNRIAK